MQHASCPGACAGTILGGVTDTTARPEVMRELVAEYLRAMHLTYLGHVAHLSPGERGALPLHGHLTVVAAAAHNLHLIATTRAVAATGGAEASIDAGHGALTWRVVFLDPSVLPALGLVDDADPLLVRQLVGVDDVVYHLTIPAGGGLTSHHAQHAAVALANQHTSLSRDGDRLRQALPTQIAEVDELISCARLGLDRAAGLLAAELTGGRVRGPMPATETLHQVMLEVRR